MKQTELDERWALWAIGTTMLAQQGLPSKMTEKEGLKLVELCEKLLDAVGLLRK